jgi:ribonucleoside-diphosphate reductase alpha chain
MQLTDWLGENNQLGIDIWQKKYQQMGETLDEWFDRVSGGNKDIRQLIVEKKFLFGGRILAYRGMEKYGRKTTLSNCYVITPPEDNIESIFDCAKKLARTYSYGGGCGTDLSKLSPRGAKINNAALTTSGATSFIDLYSLITGLIGQNSRRGALMLSLSVDHPDLEEFISLKADLNRATKANMSVRISDKFMQAVRDNKPFTLSFTRKETGETISKEINAAEVFRKMCEMNWDYAEPGALFWDRFNKWTLLSEDDEFEFAGVNPCAEECLPAGGSCLLGSLNLSEFVKDGVFHFNTFADAVRTAVIALNEVLDEGLPLHPLEEQRDSVRDWRQIGLGIFGLADMFIKMGIRYGSRGSLALSSTVGNILADTAISTSALLAKEYGTYPKCKRNAVRNSAFFQTNTNDETQRLVDEFGLRNSQLLTIAPTGTLSTMLGVSGGIEPIYANYYTRKTESLHGRDEYYKVYTTIVKEYMDAHGLTDDSELPDFFVTAQTLNFKERIDMQATWQNHIDASISSTVNVSNDFTVDDTVALYQYAWKKGLKGVTIFRDGCKRTGILTTATSKSEDLKRGEVIKANDSCIGRKRTLTTGCGTLHCQAFFDAKTGALRETYLSKGSAGGCLNFMNAVSRLTSLAMRGGIDVYAVADQLRSAGTCTSYSVRTALNHNTSRGSSCPVAVGNALIEMYEELHAELGFEDVKNNDTDATIKCPVCGNALSFEGGCNTCKACGWSKCE